MQYIEGTNNNTFLEELNAYVQMGSIDINKNTIFLNSFLIIGNLFGDKDILANYNLFVLGNIKAKRLEVNKNLIVFGKIEVNELIVGENLYSNGDIIANKLDIKNNITANSFKLTNGIVGQNLNANGQIMVVDSLKVQKNIISNEAITSLGYIKAREIISKLYIDAKNIEAENVWVLKDIQFPNNIPNSKEVKEKPSYQKSLQNIETSSDNPEKLSDLFNNVQNEIFEKWEQIITNIEEKMDYEEIQEYFEKAQKSFPVLKPIVGSYSEILKFSNLSEINTLNDFLLLLNLKINTHSSLYNISIVKDVLVNFYYQEIKKVMNLPVGTNERNKLLELLGILNEAKDVLPSIIFNHIYEELIKALVSTERTPIDLKEKTVVYGTFDREKRNYYVFKLGENELLLPKRRKLMSDVFTNNQELVPLFIKEINDREDRKLMFVSRTSPNLVLWYLNEFIPEIKYQKIKVLQIARDSNIVKVIIKSNDSNIDAITVCNEQKYILSKELPGENIDFILWTQDKLELIRRLFYPVNIFEIIEQQDNDYLLKIGSKTPDDLISPNSPNLKVIRKITKAQFTFEKQMSEEELEEWNRIL